jgi:hypothetical protein
MSASGTTQNPAYTTEEVDPALVGTWADPNMPQIPPQYDPEQELKSALMSDEQVQLVKKLIEDRWTVGMPSQEKIELLPAWPGRTGDPDLVLEPEDKQRQMKFQHMTHLTKLCIEGIIELAKNLRGFQQLPTGDQIALVKPACLEVLMINSAQYFYNDKLLMATGHWTSPEEVEEGLLKIGFGKQMWSFVRNLANMKLHDVEFALLTALCILAEDRENLSCEESRRKVRELQEPYRECMEQYCLVKHASNPTRLSNIIYKLTDLRSVSFQHKEYLFGIQLNKSNQEPLPPLLREIFDQPGAAGGGTKHE